MRVLFLRLAHLFCLCFLFVQSGQCLEIKVCPHLTLLSPQELRFSDIEQKLICGDPANPGWKKIPLFQQEFHLRAALQKFGILSVRRVSQNKDGAVLELGLPTHVRKVTGLPDSLPWRRLRLIEGSLLTPQFLNDFEKRLTRLIRQEGYPCPQIDLKAYPEGIVEVRADLGKRLVISDVEADSPRHIPEKTLRRWDAFSVGQRYHQDNVDLTILRNTQERFLSNVFFENECHDTGVTLTEKLFEAPPRLFSLGVGADTEQGPKARGTFSHLKWGKNLSRLDIEALAAYNLQSAQVKSDWYFRQDTKHFLEPILRYERRTGPQFSSQRIQFGFLPTFRWDSFSLFYELSLGPSVHLEESREPSYSRSLLSTLNISAKLQSHEFQLYQFDPKAGFETSLDIKIAQAQVFSDISLIQFQHFGKAYWNFLNYDPSLLVFCLRYGLSSTFSPVGTSLLSNQFKYFLGGSQTLRGFPYLSLKGKNGNGAKTSVFASLETRLTHTVPWGIEPLLFLDTGILGVESLSLDEATYTSVGLGVRVATQLGVIRGTFGRGFVFGQLPSRNEEAWNYFVSFGEEF